VIESSAEIKHAVSLTPQSTEATPDQQPGPNGDRFCC
jgi:hypothetical protein